MREAGPCGACAVLCSRQRGQTSPELAHFWALGVWLRLGSAQGRSASAQQRCARRPRPPPESQSAFGVVRRER